jgi:hypothetical protein
MGEGGEGNEVDLNQGILYACVEMSQGNPLYH